MKKVLSFIMAVSMLACLFVPVASAALSVYTDYLYQGFETAAELDNMSKWDATAELSPDGVFGSVGAAKMNVTSVNGGPEYRMYLTEGKMYRFSLYVKPLDFDLASANLILLTEAEEGGSGWEQVPMGLGTPNAEGYIPVSVEYRVSDRVYPGSSQPPVDKKEGAQTRVVFRMNKANINYLVDEIKVEPVDYVAFENFENAAGIPHKVTQPTESTDGSSETYSANIIAHAQSNYSTNQSGFAHISGSSTKGVYFPNLTLMPVTTYKISADVSSNPSYDIVVYPYYYLASSQNGTVVPSGHKTLGSGIAVPKGSVKQHVEFLFRTEGSGVKTYAENGITFDKFGLVTNGAYVIWDCDNLKIEKVDEVIHAGDMENVSVSGDRTKLLSDVVCATGQTAVIQRDGKDTFIEAVADDGTNADRGDYLKLHFVGMNSENAADKVSNNRRGLWYVNLKKATTYRISFWARVVTDDDSEQHDLGGMHNMGKVDANGLVNGEEGFNSNTSAYGYIGGITNLKVDNRWQYISTEYTVQNRQQIAAFYIGVDNYKPTNDVTLAIDELKIEEIGATYYDASISYANGTITASEQTGAQVGTVSNKKYTFFVSNDNVNFAKIGESAVGTFAVPESFAGKFVKAVVSGTKSDGTTISAETEAVPIPGFALRFTSDLTASNVTASATYYPEADEIKAFEGIIALYTADHNLIKAQNFASENNAATMTIENDAEVSYAKIFVWNSLIGAIPLVEFVEITK